MRPNGEVEGPADDVSQARLAHNIYRVQPRPTTSASRPPPTIVRRHLAITGLSAIEYEVLPPR